MNIPKEYAEKIGPDFFKWMLQSGNLKNKDRDTSTGWLAYENFEEYYRDVYSAVPFPPFSKIEKLWMALLRNYFMAQLKAAIVKFGWKREEVEGLVRNFVEINIDDYIEYLKSSQREATIKEIEKKYEASGKFSI